MRHPLWIVCKCFHERRQFQYIFISSCRHCSYDTPITFQRNHIWIHASDLSTSYRTPWRVFNKCWAILYIRPENNFLQKENFYTSSLRLKCTSYKPHLTIRANNIDLILSHTKRCDNIYWLVVFYYSSSFSSRYACQAHSSTSSSSSSISSSSIISPITVPTSYHFSSPS